jgi:hypothetical protein
VPQKQYKPHTSSHYVDEVVLESAIHFYMHEPDELGIPLRDALDGRFARLTGRDEPMFKERGASISVRINVSLTPHSFAVSLHLSNLMLYMTSGPAINRGVDKSLRETSATLLGL